MHSEVRIVSPQRQVGPPALARPLHREGHVVTLMRIWPIKHREPRSSWYSKP